MRQQEEATGPAAAEMLIEEAQAICRVSKGTGGYPYLDVPGS